MERDDKIFNLEKLKRRRQTLRLNATAPESILWSKLKGKQLANLKFRRQHSIENFIVDFYCSSAKLAIEIDGDSHYSERKIKEDMQRSGIIESQDVKVIRFTNKEIVENINGVLEEILKIAVLRINTTPNPSSERRGI